MIILGIDPGTVRVGYGLIKKDKGLTMVACGIVGDMDKNHIDRLAHIGAAIRELIKKYKPDLMGVEMVYFSKNKKTAMSVAEARGVILFAAREAGVPVVEFSPSDVKRVVAGDGRADKKSLAKIVEITLGVKNIDGPDDVTDALAIAIRASFEKPYMRN